MIVGVLFGNRRRAEASNEGKGRSPQPRTASEQGGAHPLIRALRSTDPAGGVFVGASQPLAQPIGGLPRGRSIKGHQRGGDAGNPDDARAPAIGRDSGDLDQVRVSADEFFEAMDSYAHGRGGCVCLGG